MRPERRLRGRDDSGASLSRSPVHIHPGTQALNPGGLGAKPPGSTPFSSVAFSFIKLLTVPFRPFVFINISRPLCNHLNRRGLAEHFSALFEPRAIPEIRSQSQPRRIRGGIIGSRRGGPCCGRPGATTRFPLRRVAAVSDVPASPSRRSPRAQNVTIGDRRYSHCSLDMARCQEKFGANFLPVGKIVCPPSKAGLSFPIGRKRHFRFLGPRVGGV